MNRSILIVICDFLLLSLLTFSTDLSKMAGENEGAQPGAGVEVAPKPVDTGGKDLAAVMKLALNEEQKNREQLQAELAKVREAAQKQQADLQQQFAAAQANLQILDQKLQSSSAEALMSKEKLAAMEAEVKKESDLAAALQQQLAQLAKNNQIAQDEKQKLAGQLRLAQVEKRAATEKAALMQQQVQAERAEKAQLAEGFKALATNSGALTQEIRENRALAPNTIFSDFVTNRVQARLLASRSGMFGLDASKSRTAETVLVTDGANIYALCHVQDTPLTLWDPGTDWAGTGWNAGPQPGAGPHPFAVLSHSGSACGVHAGHAGGSPSARLQGLSGFVGPV